MPDVLRGVLLFALFSFSCTASKGDGLAGLATFSTSTFVVLLSVGVGFVFGVGAMGRMPLAFSKVCGIILKRFFF